MTRQEFISLPAQGPGTGQRRWLPPAMGRRERLRGHLCTRPVHLRGHRRWRRRGRRPPAIGDKLSAAIASVTDKPVTHFVCTHSQLDHVAAVHQFPDAIRIAHAECARLLAFRANPARPLPQQVFNGKRSTLSVGAETVELIYPARTTRSATSWGSSPAQRLVAMTHTTQKTFGELSFAELVTRWHDRIAAADTFTSDTVAAAVESISTDSPIRIL